MKYIIMCGGDYNNFSTPKQLLKVNNEVLIERTIRLLRENGINDIAISTNNPAFNYLDIPILRHNNNFVNRGKYENINSKYSWLNAYYPMNEPCCYLHGDVYYTDNAIKKIVETKVKDTMFFCIKDIQDGRKTFNTKGREPLAYKVENQKLFRNAINDLLKMVDEGKFKDIIPPFSWHLYRYINGLEYLLANLGDVNNIFETKGDYTVIDDYTTDIDSIIDISRIENIIKKGGNDMVKVEVIEGFTLKDFDLLKDIERKGVDKVGELFVGDTFKCDENMVKYLTGENLLNKVVVKVIEVIPEKKEEIKIEKDSIAKEIKSNKVEKPKKSKKNNK